VPALSRWMRRPALLVAEPRSAPIVVHQMGHLATTFNRTVDTQDRRLQMSLLACARFRCLGARRLLPVRPCSFEALIDAIVGHDTDREEQATGKRGTLK
jgi:hypothetical protein